MLNVSTAATICAVEIIKASNPLSWCDGKRVGF